MIEPASISALETECRRKAAALANHKFIQNLRDDSLPRPTFAQFLLEDSVYLIRFAELLSKLAEASDLAEYQAQLRDHVAETNKFAQDFRTEAEKIVPTLPDNAGIWSLRPCLYGYANHLAVAMHSTSFLVGISACLPCYWVYHELGRTIKGPHLCCSEYKQWLNGLSSQASDLHALQITEIAERAFRAATDSDRLEAAHALRRSLYYEQQAFDSFLTGEDWT